MASQTSKLLTQIAFNLLLMIILLVGLVTVVRDLLTGRGDLGENLFLLAVLGVILFIGGGLLSRLIRTAFRKGKS